MRFGDLRTDSQYRGARRFRERPYQVWGAHSKVKQLDDNYPDLHLERDSSSPTPHSEHRAENLDLATVVKVSQAVSGEIILPKLIDALMATALQHAGADRGLLILL